MYRGQKRELSLQKLELWMSVSDLGFRVLNLSTVEEQLVFLTTE